MTELRALDQLTDDAVREAYAPVRTPWFRLNFVATADGAVQGPDGLSKSINNAADKRVFRTLRRMADVVIAGAGTMRDEVYKPNPKPMVVLTRSGEVPPSLLAGDTSQVFVATAENAPHLEDSRRLLGRDQVLVLGEHTPDLVEMRRALEERGWRDLLCEGGPHVARDLLSAGVVDELCLTIVPRLIGSDHLRVLAGGPVDVPLRLHGLLEQDGTLLGRWLVDRDAPA